MSSAAAATARDFHLRWAAMGAPQRPTSSVADGMAELLKQCAEPALQLGVTPEIAHVARRGVALDWSEEMVRLAWPGDRDTHRAVVGNWLAMPFADGVMGSVFGDASLTMLRWPEQYDALFDEVLRVLRPGGRLVLRCFTGPQDCESPAALMEAAWAGQIATFGAFKLRFNMAAFACAGPAGNTGDHIHRSFLAHCSDRERLARATGWRPWDIASFDFYAGATYVHSYPTRAQLAARLPAGASHRFVATAGYPLAERCPLLVVDFDEDDRARRQEPRDGR